MLFKIAMIKDGVIQNVSVWDKVTPWEPTGVAHSSKVIDDPSIWKEGKFDLVDVTGIECQIGERVDLVKKEITKIDATKVIYPAEKEFVIEKGVPKGK